MKARLRSRFGPGDDLNQQFTERITIGRSSQSDVTVKSDRVSAQHAKIVYDADLGCYVLSDLESRSGTQLDGVAVERPVRLGRLHVITLAEQVDLVFQDLERSPQRAVVEPPAVPHREPSPPAGSAPPPARAAAPIDGTVVGPAAPPPPSRAPAPPAAAPIDGTVVGPAAPPPPSRASAPPAAAPIDGTVVGPAAPPPPTRAPAPAPAVWEVVVGSGSEELRFRLVEGDNGVGREASNTVRLPSSAASRQHAVLTLQAGRLTVRDLGSQNGTYLNGRVVPSTEAVEVGPDALILFGVDEGRIEVR